MKNSLLVTILFLVFSMVAPRAEAIYYFESSNALGAWSGAVPPGYGYVDVTRGANNWIFFEVGANADYFPADDPGLNWTKFYFNYAGDLDAGMIVVDETGSWNVVEGRNVSEFGRFAFGLEGNAAGNSANNPLRFHIEDASLDPAAFALANDLGWLFAGHLQRFEAMDEITSTYLASSAIPSTPVPEPGTLLLIGAGLGSLALRRRKTNN